MKRSTLIASVVFLVSSPWAVHAENNLDLATRSDPLEKALNRSVDTAYSYVQYMKSQGATDEQVEAAIRRAAEDAISLQMSVNESRGQVRKYTTHASSQLVEPSERTNDHLESTANWSQPDTQSLNPGGEGSGSAGPQPLPRMAPESGETQQPADTGGNASHGDQPLAKVEAPSSSGPSSEPAAQQDVRSEPAGASQSAPESVGGADSGSGAASGGAAGADVMGGPAVQAPTQ